MADPAHVQTDALIEEIERKLRKQYARAAREIEKKLENHLDGFRQKIEGRKQALKDGEITQQEYNNWFHGQIMTGRRWQALQAQISDDLLNANAIARKTAEGYKADVYALNVNFATYDVEHAGLLDTNFTLYDRDTVERIMREEPQLLPPPGKLVKKEIAEGKAERWNLQTFNSVMMQGIVQGESVEKLTTRVSTELSSRNYAASVRYARTAMTSAQNAGRYEGYRRAQNLGVQLKIEWSATLDQRTRHDHRMLHGQRREIDEPFEVDGIKILYPAQSGPGSSDIPQSMIWNCRCTLLAWVKGFEGETVKSSPKMGDMSFEEWQNDKVSKNAPKKQNVASQATNPAPKKFTLSTGTQYQKSDLTERVENNFRFSDGTRNGARFVGKARIYTTPDGLDIVFQEYYNKAHQTMTVEQLLNAYNKVPDAVRTKGQKRIVVQDVYNPQDRVWRQKYKGFTHSYAVGGDEIIFWRYDAPHDDDWLVRSLCHEMGHYIDYDGNYPNGQKISRGNDWATAMAADLKKSGKKSPTTYGENASEEDFAESIASLVEEYSIFKTDFPHRFRLLKKILKQ